MVEHHFSNPGFIQSLVELIQANIGDEDFGAKELAKAAGISQRKLSFKLRTTTNKSISRFITEIRLQQALELLRKEDITASEVAYKVGFGSATYFNTCFRSFFGYPPGKVRKGISNDIEGSNPDNNLSESLPKKSSMKTAVYVFGGLLILTGFFPLVNRIFIKSPSAKDSIISSKERERSIAVLPFENLSDSTANQYFIDGLRDEIFTDLSHIHDLRITSRTSVEQFRESDKTAAEIAKKLDVEYIVEGSGQKYDNSYQLRIQLIDAKNDKQLWAESYDKEIRETKDIYGTQSEIAQLIATKLKATITPQEKQLIDKIPTINLTAYDFYQKAEEENMGGYPEFNAAAARRKEVLLHKALKCDSTYAQAYAGLAEILWVRIDRDTTITDINIFNKYLDSMLVLTNIALSNDDKLAAAYNLRGVYYGYKGSAKKAEEEYDKAIRINPNDKGAYGSKMMIYMDVDLVKTLENFQKMISLSHGSELVSDLKWVAQFYSAAGFPEKANDFCLEALKLDGDSVMYLKGIVDLAASFLGDYKRAIEYYEKGLLRDSTDTGVVFKLGGFYLQMGKYQKSLNYYKKYISLLRSRGETKPPLEPSIAYAYLQNGYKKEADFYFNKMIESFSNPFVRYHFPGYVIWDEYALSAIYACRGDKGKAYEHLKMFDQVQSVGLQWVNGIKNDPLFNSIRNEPEFQKVVRNMETRYQAEHKRVKKWMEEQGKL